jgi:hypothetical protein
VIEKWKQEPVRIVGPLKSRINQLAHRWALADELRHREAITSQLNALAASGTRLQELHEALDALEAEAR